MERRNLDFEIAVTREQWDQLGRSAAALPDSGVLDWSVEQPEVIRVRMAGDDVPPGFNGFIGDSGTYGSESRPAAEFVYNDGRPFAAIAAPDNLEPPVVRPQQQAALQRQLENWVRNKWHHLLDEAGFDLTAG